MNQTTNNRPQTTDEISLKEKVNAINYWYHKIELPGGIVTPGNYPICAERYCIPDDLTGKRVLDIGAWDGYWTWEALKRGAAEVVAIDDFSDDCGRSDIKRNGWETFDICREAFGFTEKIMGDFENHKSNYYNSWVKKDDFKQKISRIEMSIYDIKKLDHFDIVFLFGTIYHLRHPLLALEKISAVCDGSIYIETAICDDFSVYNKNHRGFNQYEFVMEFYPFDEYCNNPSNWWSPTLQCLGAMLESVGFKDVDCWALTDNPKQICECRGFASGTKKPKEYPANKPDDVKKIEVRESLKTMAVMSVPRLGFMDNFFCAFEALMPLQIPIRKEDGAFWGQCLERAMQRTIDARADLLLTIDYDTIFSRYDVEKLIEIMHKYPDISALIPIQSKRGGGRPLLTVKGPSGMVLANVPAAEFQNEVTKIATGHFGLTMIRVKDLLDIGHPWFKPEPDYDGQWGPGKVDDDIYFWKLLEKNGKKVCSANRVTIGHLERVITWPDTHGTAVYQQVDNYRRFGKPEKAWK
jgi:tRNA (mo5U34)-methyltransferase